VESGGAVLRIGRAPGNAVWTPDDRVVSAQHAKVVRLEGRYLLLDLDSTNGTYLNGQRVERAALADGDVIGLGHHGPELRVEVLAGDAPGRASQATVVVPNFAELARRSPPTTLAAEVPLDRDSLTVGRGEAADVRLDSPIVSRLHARFTRRDGAWRVEDLESSNGTFLNGRSVERAPLAAGDRVVVGPHVLELTATALRVLDTRSRARLDALELGVEAGGRALLADVSLHLPAGSLTAIIGPSGSGKSTLLTALAGVRRPMRGSVRLNGLDLHAQFAALKGSLGYVPQDDIVHRELAVGESLDYTARLRLPADTAPAERERRVAEVLASLELTDRRALPIARLSGGQRKRVSIAAELLTEPALLFLDEPTSGLDPGLEEALMLLLREQAYKGKTVVLVTHTLDHLELCDAVALLGEGRLLFLGPPREAREHFGIAQDVNLYARLKERPAAEWQEAYRASDGYRRRVAEPLAGAAPRAAAAPPGPGGAARSPAASARQLAILARRYLATLTRDARNALMLVGQAPLVAGLIGLSLLYGAGDVAYAKPKNTLLLLLSLSAVWFGCSNAAREIVKERAIYLRERLVNLRILPYVLSKLLVLGGIAAVQCVLFLLVLDLWFGIPGRPELLFLSMLLVSGVGILLGLALSALAASADRAMTLLPLLLIPQVLFTFPAVQMDMGGPAGLVARAMPTWWGFDLLRRVALAPGAALEDEATYALCEAGGPVLMSKARFESMLQQGYMMFQHRGAIEVAWAASFPERLGASLPGAPPAWRAALADALVLLGMGGSLLLATAALLRRREPSS
jgi:ABC-type multidrug transport system ATPase subunit/pSer/pThr/pTyr-binding forkhead associated (FHA) protein